MVFLTCPVYFSRWFLASLTNERWNMSALPWKLISWLCGHKLENAVWSCIQSTCWKSPLTWACSPCTHVHLEFHIKIPLIAPPEPIAWKLARSFFKTPTHNAVDHFYLRAVDTSTKLWHISEPRLPFSQVLLPLLPKRLGSLPEQENSLMVTDSPISPRAVSLASLQLSGYLLETLWWQECCWQSARPPSQTVFEAVGMLWSAVL